MIPDPSEPGSGHAHVIGLETASPNGGRQWTVVEFVRAVRLGDRFYLRDGSVTLEVDPTVCDGCSRVTIAANPARREG